MTFSVVFSHADYLHACLGTIETIEMSADSEKINCKNTSKDLLEITHHSIMIDESEMHVHVLHLNRSAMVWINSTDISMKNLVVAMPTNFSKDSTAINLLGDRSSATSCTLAQRLSKRTNQQIFISFNLPDIGTNFLNNIEPYLVEILS